MREGEAEKKRFECFGTATTQDTCLQCPDNEECVIETLRRMSNEPKTLKQILEEKEHYHVPMGLEVNEAVELVREWLQQNLKPIANDLAKYAISSEDSAKFTLIALKLDKILEELTH